MYELNWMEDVQRIRSVVPRWQGRRGDEERARWRRARDEEEVVWIEWIESACPIFDFGCQVGISSLQKRELGEDGFAFAEHRQGGREQANMRFQVQIAGERDEVGDGDRDDGKDCASKKCLGFSKEASLEGATGSRNTARYRTYHVRCMCNVEKKLDAEIRRHAARAEGVTCVRDVSGERKGQKMKRKPAPWQEKKR